jgi:hypothetical protein
MMEERYHSAAARAVAEWFDSRDPDDLGTIIESISALGKSARDWCPDLSEHARNVMELAAGAKCSDPQTLGAFSELLEHAAQRIKTAALTLARE